MIFPCDKCGLCCKHIELIPQLKEYDSGNGRCIHLTDNNLCGIYDNRPDICNVSRMFDLVFCHQMSKDEYIEMNMTGCRKLKERFNSK